MWGPHDPHFGEGVTLATNIVKRRFPVVPPGGMHIADVRDVAAALVAVMTPGRGQRRYLIGGHYISMPDLVRTLADLSGRRIPFVTFPSWFLGAFGRTADLVQRRLRTQLCRPLRRLQGAHRARARGPPTTRHIRRHRPLAGRSRTPQSGRMSARRATRRDRWSKS